MDAAGLGGRTLCVRGEYFELVPAHAARGGVWRVPLAHHLIASALARKLANAGDSARLRALARTFGADVAAHGDQGVIWSLVRAVEDGRLVVVRAEAPQYRPNAAYVPRDVEPADVGPATTDTRSHWVALKIVDDDSAEPIEDLDLVVVLPDHSEHRPTTDSSGRVELRSATAGSCDVRSHAVGEYFMHCSSFVGFGPAFKRAPTPTATRAVIPRGRPCRADGERALLDVLAYHVRDGDTWDSIAADHGVAPAALMRFNFDTADPSRIQVAMSEHLGCWRRDPDSGRLVFTADDDPGILLVPRPWQTSVATGYEHTLRVRAVRAPARPYLFSV